MAMIESLAEFVYKKRVFLYGTGKFSEWMSGYLKKNRVDVSGYVISNKSLGDTFMNRPVFCISDIDLVRDDCLILAVINKEYLEEIKILIKKFIKISCVYYPQENEDLKRLCIKCFQSERAFLSKKRKKVSIFKYKEISRPLPFRKSLVYFRDDEELYAYFCCINYGIDRCVKKYLKSCEFDELGSTVIHGVRVYSRFTHRELNPPNGNIFCMSSCCFEKKEEGIYRNNIYSIGPYVKWVRPLLSKNKIKKIKERFGKTLLVIPSHVQLKKVAGNIPFDTSVFIDEIERVKQRYGFQTVLISIGPYTDVREATVVYGGKHYRLISSGEPHDMFFLSRLRTFIEISDVAMGNDVWSTFPGYSVALNRPYYHFEQPIDYKDALQDNLLRGFEENCEDREEQYKNEFLQCFGIYSDAVSDMQRAFVAKYWGVKRKIRDN